MTSRCSFADDHALGSSALAEHATTCEACARAVALRSLAKQTWSAAKGRDDRTARSARERRLMRGVSVGRGRKRGLAWSAVLAIVAVAATCMMLLRHEAPPSSPPSAPQPLAASNGAAPATTAPHAAPKTRGFRVVDVRGGVARRRGAAITAGDALAAGDAIDVEQGAIVRVLWVIDLDERDDGGVEPEVEIVGPAQVDVGDAASPLLVLRRGVARVTAGEVAIARGADAARDVRSGSRVEVDSIAHAAAARSTITAPDDSAALLRAAEAALDQGDRASAEATLRTLLDHARDPDTRARAELRLAELLLARGASDEARTLLEPLAFGREPKRGADAAWLYARSLHAPADRASAWARYLATSPPPAMRSLALVERASALLDAGDADGARAIVTALEPDRASGSLAPVAADALRRLEARLGDD